MEKETKLKSILKEKRMSQTELYNRIKEECIVGIGLDVISKIYSGKKSNYHIDTLLKICVALNVTPNDIIEKENFIKVRLKK